jgi:ribonuclease HI
MHINWTKTKAMTFTRKRQRRELNLKVFDQTIQEVKFTKYLGLTLDSKLTWKRQLQETLIKTASFSNILRRITATTWGIDPRPLQMIYKQAFEPALYYGSILYPQNIKSTTNLLQRSQHKLLCQIFRLPFTTPTNALFAETRTPPFLIEAEHLAENFILRKTSTNSLILPKLQLIHELQERKCRSNYMKALPLICKAYSSLSPQLATIQRFHTLPCYLADYAVYVHEPNINYPPYPSTKICKQIPHLAANIFRNYINDLPATTVRIFTDGSKTDGPVGAAFYDETHNFHQNYKLPTTASIFFAEAWAIRSALLYTQRQNYNHVCICTDSHSVLQALLQKPWNPKLDWLITNIKRLIFNRHNRNMHTEFVWLPSHTNIDGNTMADSLAHIGRTIGQEAPIKLPSTTLTQRTKVSKLRKWEAFNSSTTVSKWYWQYPLQLHSQPWYLTYNLTRQQLIQLIRLRLHVANTPARLHLLRKRDTALCDCGLEPGDINHLVFNCSGNEVHRSQFLNLVYYKYGPGPLNVDFILANNDYPIITSFLAYLQCNEIKL